MKHPGDTLTQGLQDTAHQHVTQLSHILLGHARTFPLIEFEKRVRSLLIRAAVTHTKGNAKRAAKIVGVSRCIVNNTIRDEFAEEVAALRKYWATAYF